MAFMFPPPVGQTPSHGGFANFDAFGSSAGPSAFGSIPPGSQGLFQAQPIPTGKLCPALFPFPSAPLLASDGIHVLPFIRICTDLESWAEATEEKEKQAQESKRGAEETSWQGKGLPLHFVLESQQPSCRRNCGGVHRRSLTGKLERPQYSKNQECT